MHSDIYNCEKIWINARLATMDPQVKGSYGLLEDSLIGVKNGKIACIYPMDDIKINGFRGEIIDAQGNILTPGLIDSHTHLIYGGQRAA